MGKPDKLSFADSATLRTWRAANLIGWSLGALLVAVALSLAVDILTYDVLDAALDIVVSGGAIPPPEVAVVYSALIVGGGVGAVIGSRVYRWPLTTSIVVMLIFLALWPSSMIDAGWLDPGWLWTSLSVSLHLGAAVLAARLIYRRRKHISESTHRQEHAASPKR
jgi:hypothetical protein